MNTATFLDTKLGSVPTRIYNTWHETEGIFFAYNGPQLTSIYDGKCLVWFALDTGHVFRVNPNTSTVRLIQNTFERYDTPHNLPCNMYVQGLPSPFQSCNHQHWQLDAPPEPPHVCEPDGEIETSCIGDLPAYVVDSDWRWHKGIALEPMETAFGPSSQRYYVPTVRVLANRREKKLYFCSRQDYYELSE